MHCRKRCGILYIDAKIEINSENIFQDILMYILKKHKLVICYFFKTTLIKKILPVQFLYYRWKLIFQWVNNNLKQVVVFYLKLTSKFISRVFLGW